MIGKRKRFENPLEQYARILRKRWLMIALMFIVTLGATVLYNMSQQPRYATSAKILIEARPGTGSDTQATRVNTVDYYLTQFEILKSGPILAKVVDKLDLTETYQVAPTQLETLRAKLMRTELAPRRGGSREGLVAILKGAVRMQPQTHAGLLVVSVRGSHPEQVRDICNTLVDTFKDESISSRMQERFAATEYLSRQLTKLNLKLQESQATLEEFQRSEGIQGISDQATVDTQQYREFMAKYMTTHEEVWELETRIEFLREFIVQEDFEDITMTHLKNEELDSLSHQLFEAKLELDRLRKQDYREKHPHIVQAKDNIELLKKQLSHEAVRYFTGLEAELSVLKKREETLRAMGLQYQASAPETFRKRAQYEYLQRDVDLHRSLYASYDQQIKEMQLADDQGAATIRVIEPAKTPGAPYSPKKRGALLVGVLVGLSMGIFLAFFREYMDNTIRSADDVSDYLEVPVLGTIPIIETTTKTGDVIQRRSFSGSVVSESYHSLRTNLQFFETDRQIKTLLVTSPGPGEGKSTTVANLALTLVQTGKRVCIVDTDLRKPVQHRLFKRSNEYGLTSIFAGVTEKKRLLARTGFENLYLLACGPIPPNPAELLASSKMTEAVRNLHKDFDYVLFDSPPVLLVSDALVLSSLVDGVLLVLRAGEATIPTSQHALESLQSVKAKLIGSVLNHFDIKNARYYGHYYSKYYRYGYGYGEKESAVAAGANPQT